MAGAHMENLLVRARALHRTYGLVDGHADSILDVLDGQRSLTERSDRGHLDFPRALEAGVACTVQTAFPGAELFSYLPSEVRHGRDGYHVDPVRRVAQGVDAIMGQIDASAGQALLVRTAGDIRRAHREGKLAVLLNIEGAEGIGGDLAMLRNYHRMGLRMMGLVWNYRNAVADGAGEEGRGGSLTRFGEQVVREMNRLGLVIDLAHITAPGFYQVLEISSHPVLFTHGNCRALWEHPRNLTDDQIRALAAQGGVFGISFVSAFMNRETATLKTVADHIDHVVQLLGNSHHVAYGSDFDGCSPPPGLEDVTRLPALTAELLRRGYAEADLEKILGGNFLRVISTVLGE